KRRTADGTQVVSGIQITILKILVEGAVELVSPASDDGVELAARGMAEIGRELVRKEGELRDCIVWNAHERACNAAAVVVNPFYGEVVIARSLATDRRPGSGTDGTAGRNT